MKFKKAIIFTLGLIFIAKVGWAEPGSLYERFEGKTLKVYVADVTDSSKERKLNASDIKTKLTEALQNRRSIKFQRVESVAEADIAIEVDVKDFMWSDHDPVDMLVGIGGTAMDAAVVEDYAKVEAVITVKEKEKVIWTDKVIATITKKPMSETDSLPLISEDLAKVFVKECFGKKRGA